MFLLPGQKAEYTGITWRSDRDLPPQLAPRQRVFPRQTSSREGSLAARMRPHAAGLAGSLVRGAAW